MSSFFYAKICSLLARRRSSQPVQRVCWPENVIDWLGKWRPTCVMRHARGQKLQSFRRKWPFYMDLYSMIKGSGCRWVPVVAAWHGRHVLTFCSTILSMEGNQTFSRRKWPFYMDLYSMIKGSGCRWVPVVAAWHGRHVLTFCSTILSMEGNQTFSRSSIFVLTMPWWPTCARSMAWLCSE